MSVALAVGVIAGSVALMVAAMLVVRARFAPAGGYFRNTDRAAAVFGFLGAGFAILLGFVVLLSFERYSDAKDHAAGEASAVFEQYQSAPPRIRADLQCYARAVIALEWPAMEHGRSASTVDRWAEAIDTRAPGPQAAARNDARRQRLLEAKGTLPALLWIMLIIAAVSVAGYALLFADPEERLAGQALTAAAVTALLVSSLLAVTLLASPFQGGHGSVGPQAMRYSLQLVESESLHGLVPACDRAGNPA